MWNSDINIVKTGIKCNAAESNVQTDNQYRQESLLLNCATLSLRQSKQHLGKVPKDRWILQYKIRLNKADIEDRRNWEGVEKELTVNWISNDHKGS